MLQLRATGDWQLHQNNMPTHASHLVQSFLVKHHITQVSQTPYSLDLVPCNFWLFPKLKSPLKGAEKGKRYQTSNDIQENVMGQLMATGRTVWGPTVPTLKGTEASFSYVQHFLFLVSSSINVFIFHTTWMDTFWTDFMCLAGPMVLWDLFYSLSSYATRRSTGGNHKVSDENFAPLKLIASLCTETL